MDDLDTPPLAGAEPDEPSDPAPSHPVGRGRRNRPRRSRRDLVSTFLAVGVVAIFALQLYLVVGMADLTDRIDRLADDVTALGVATAASSPAPDAAAPGPQPGDLPRFDPNAADTAVGLRLGPVSGTDYPSGEPRTIDPADGTKRIWLVWAHWCPYCQQELPLVSEWYPTQDLPGMELVSVTTSIDPSRGNPLEPYLEELALPFPVVVDEDQSAARRLGVTAFPFWVVTAGDGTVLYRTAGLLPIDRLQQIVDRLAELS